MKGTPGNIGKHLQKKEKSRESDTTSESGRHKGDGGKSRKTYREPDTMNPAVQAKSIDGFIFKANEENWKTTSGKQLGNKWNAIEK